MADYDDKNVRPAMQEIATTADGRDITRGYLDPLAIQPVTDPVLKIRGNGDYRIYSEILRDDQVSSCFGQRRLAVIGKEFAVDPGGKTKSDKAAAEFLLEQLNHIGWDRVTNKMLFGVFYGFAVSEPMWARDGRFITLDKLLVRDRRRFGFDGKGLLRLKTFSSPEGELLPPRKFWSFATGADHDDEPYGLGLGHALYWPAFFKRNGLRYWLIFLEKFGQPTAKGTYPGTAEPADKAKLLQALAAISTDSGIAVPEGMVIELLEAARSGTADYVSLYDRMDRAIAKVCLGQTASTEGTPGRLGNDDLQGDVRLDLVKADADLVCESFNRSIARWLTEWNFPGAKPPRVYRKVEPDEDSNQRAERDKTIFDMGFKPSLQYIRENYGSEWEEKAVITDQSQIPTPSPAADFAMAPASIPAQMQQQAVDTISPAVDGWVEQIRTLVNEVETLEELRDRLLELYPDMTLDEYAAAMGDALTAANLAGRSSIVEESKHG